MAKSKAEQLANLIISMELDELHGMSNMIQKLIEEKSVVEETEEEILTRRLLELKRQKGVVVHKGDIISHPKSSREDNSKILAKAGRTNQHPGTKQARSEPMKVGPRPNELFKYIKSDEAKADSLDDKKLFGGSVERSRGNGLVVVQCVSCSNQVQVSASTIHSQSTFVCDNCIKNKGENR